MKFLKRFKTGWRNFWGTRYSVYENEKLIQEVILYHKKFYIIKKY